MGYLKDNLLPNERLIYTAHIHPAILLPVVPIFVIAGVFLFLGTTQAGAPAQHGIATFRPMYVWGAMLVAIAGLYGVLRVVIFVLSTEFGLTDRRIIAKRGLIQRRSLELLLGKVESVQVSQDLLGRIFDFGTVTITGTGGTRERFPAIAAPLSLRRLIHQQIGGTPQSSARP